MPGRYAYLDTEDQSIHGEVLDERDLVNESNLMTLNTPDGVDQEWLLGELWKDLERGEHAEAVLAEAEMRRVIELNRSLDHRFIEGAGQCVARIPMSVAMHWIARYGQEFWKHKDSLDFIAARNPGFLIKTQGKPQVVVDGFRDQVSPATAEDAASGVSGVRPAGAAQAAPAEPVRGRRGRWALPTAAHRSPTAAH